MSDRFPRVRPGEPQEFTAAQVNAYSATAEAYATGSFPGQESASAAKAGDWIRVRNDTAETVPRFGNLGIGSLLIEPEIDSTGPLPPIAVGGVAALLGEHDRRFVITQEPIPPGRIGRAKADGVTYARVNVVDVTDLRAGILDDDPTQLGSRDTGTLLLMTPPAVTGPQLALVRFANFPLKIQVEIHNITNEYFDGYVVGLNGVAKPTQSIRVARPYKCRADTSATHHPEAVSMTVHSPNRVTATGATGDSETVETRPWGYAVGDRTVIEYVGHTGVSFNGEQVQWIDGNLNAHAWSFVNEATQIEEGT